MASDVKKVGRPAIDPTRPKTCTACGAVKQPSEFNRRSYKGVSTLTPRCRECNIAKTRRWEKDNPAKSAIQRRNRTMRDHGISQDEYVDLLISQCGVCAICYTQSAVPLVIDHDHACCPDTYSCGKCIRGLLCGPCNVGLGAFRDDPTAILSAASYIINRSPL